MSSVLPLESPEDWEVRRLGSVVTRSKEANQADLQPLSVFLDQGVVPKTSREDNHNRLGADMAKYLVVRPGDLVFNKLRTWQGGLGVSSFEGVVSPAYFVCRPGPKIEPRFLHHLLRSSVYLAELTRLSKFMPPSQFDIGWDELKTLPVLVPPLRQQRAMVEYLDRETARIDTVIAKKQQVRDLLQARFKGVLHAAVSGKLTSVSNEGTRPGPGWVEELPAHWGLPWLGAICRTTLGKMLNPEAASGPEQYEYLRNVNVQWGHFDLTDVQMMHFDASDRVKHRLRRGDLLVCEGGEVGRSAVWAGEREDLFFQKAIHRVRPLGRDTSTRYLMYAFWAAASRGVFREEGNTATLVHLTGEKLRAHRIPMPPPAEQVEIGDRLDQELKELTGSNRILNRQVELLRERRVALITATVTGELEVAA